MKNSFKGSALSFINGCFLLCQSGKKTFRYMSHCNNILNKVMQNSKFRRIQNFKKMSQILSKILCAIVKIPILPGHLTRILSFIFLSHCNTMSLCSHYAHWQEPCREKKICQLMRSTRQSPSEKAEGTWQSKTSLILNMMTL